MDNPLTIYLLLDPFIDFSLPTNKTSSSSPILAKLHTTQAHLLPLFSSVGSGPANSEFPLATAGGLVYVMTDMRQSSKTVSANQNGSSPSTVFRISSEFKDTSTEISILLSYITHRSMAFARQAVASTFTLVLGNYGTLRAHRSDQDSVKNSSKDGLDGINRNFVLAEYHS